MPGVLIDDQNFHLDTMPQSSFYETLGSYSTSPLNQPHQMMRHSSFKESSTNGLSHSAPVYNRSQSAISPAAVMNAFNYFSPPNTPKKGNEGGFSGLSMADVEEYNNLADEERIAAGLGSPSSVGLGAQASNAIAMVIAGNNASNDLRSLAFGNSALVGSPTLPDSVTALHKFLPSNDEDECWGNSVVDVYACDQFRMFEFKVRRCMRGRSHDWTECPFAHPGEKARRRDPRRFHYSGTACPDFRKGSCRRGDACEFAHGVFECWLHPARYRTQPCKDGRNCRRRVCFFAHTPEQLRLLPAAAHANAAARNGGMSGSQGSVLSGAGSLSGSYDGSPGRGGASYDGAYSFDGTAGCVSHCSPTSHGSCQNGVPNGACSHFEHTYGGNVSNLCCASQMSSPTSTLVGHSPSPPPLSPPLSPSGSPPMSPQSPHWSSSPSLHQQSINSSITSFMNQTLSTQAGGYPVHSGYSQGPSSPLSRPSNSNSVMSAIQVPGPHMNNITSAAQRRHLDRLNSMPALSIPPVDHSHRGMLQSVTSPLSSPSSCSPPSPGGANHHNSVSDLIATIQQLGLRGNGGLPLWVAAQSMQAANQAQSIQAANQYSSGPSPLRRCSQSVPSTPTKPRWEGDGNRFAMDSTTEEVEPPVQRVESGRDLRAKIYGRLGKENRTDNGDTPDLGWVNELVKDEQLW